MCKTSSGKTTVYYSQRFLSIIQYRAQNDNPRELITLQMEQMNKPRRQIRRKKYMDLYPFPVYVYFGRYSLHDLWKVKTKVSLIIYSQRLYHTNGSLYFIYVLFIHEGVSPLWNPMLTYKNPEDNNVAYQFSASVEEVRSALLFC